MVDEVDDKYARAQAEYRRLMYAYGEALSAKDPIATSLFEQATAMWKSLRDFHEEDSKVDPDMHLVLALSFAIQAGDSVEAKRHYDAMSEESRGIVDGVEALEPGSMKIWL